MRIFILLFLTSICNLELFIFDIYANGIKNIQLEKHRTFLALGDSYTIGEAVSAEERWPHLLRDALKQIGIQYSMPEIIAQTGWRTDELLEAIHNHGFLDKYDLVSLLIGVNNQYQSRSIDTYEVEFEQLLRFSINKANGDSKHVFVLSIPDYGCTPFGECNSEKIMKEIDDYNSINQRISKKYGVYYFNITEISRMVKGNPSFIAVDGLHPSGKQYMLWVQKILSNSAFIEQLRHDFFSSSSPCSEF